MEHEEDIPVEAVVVPPPVGVDVDSVLSNLLEAYNNSRRLSDACAKYGFNLVCVSSDGVVDVVSFDTLNKVLLYLKDSRDNDSTCVITFGEIWEASVSAESFYLVDPRGNRHVVDEKEEASRTKKVVKLKRPAVLLDGLPVERP